MNEFEQIKQELHNLIDTLDYDKIIHTKGLYLLVNIIAANQKPITYDILKELEVIEEAVREYGWGTSGRE